MNDQVKIVHLGLGAFFKAHSAWYTFKCSDWKIAAFTGRSAKAADELILNNYKYKLVTKSIEGDIEEIIDSIVEAFDGNDTQALNDYIASPNVALVTLTITEAGYTSVPGSMIYKLLNALEKRFESNAKPIAIVPCDNLIQNGAKVKSLFEELTQKKSESFRNYLRDKVSIVSTSVDRITPKSELPNTVITEPYSAWVLQGEFPSGRPSWENAGAKFVEDIKPYENRKLWLLNGAHSLLAYAGINNGFKTVSEAIKDDEILQRVAEFWEEAAESLNGIDLDVRSYQDSLIKRFSNPNIEHQLHQIAIDGSMKLKERIIPIIKIRIEKNRSSSACQFVLAQWIQYVTNNEFIDVNNDQINLALKSINPNQALISILDNSLAKSDLFLESIAKIQTSRKNEHVETSIK